MAKERLYLFDTTLRGPYERSRAVREHEQWDHRRRATRQVGHG
jgi:hypothetical protein